MDKTLVISVSDSKRGEILADSLQLRVVGRRLDVEKGVDDKLRIPMFSAVIPKSCNGSQ